MQIVAKELDYIYQQGTVFAAPALHDVSFEIPTGQMVAMIGHSGSGKSTLAHLIGGLILPSSGSVSVDGKQADVKNTFRQVGLVFQYPEQQFFGETVLEEVSFGPKNFGVPQENLEAVVKKALADVGLKPELFLERSPFTLSGGEQRRVAIASVLATDPQILIFDEPTAGLDVSGRNWIMDLARQYHEKGRTILWISHHMQEVADLAERILVVSHGQLIADGTPQEVFAQTLTLQEHGLDIPEAALLVRRLKEQGKPVPGLAVTLDQAYEEIHAWLKGGAL